MQIPKTFGGRFTVLGELVRRPSSILYRASDRVLGDREVALKVFLDQPGGNGQWIADYDRQVSQLRKASHPVLIPIIAGGYEDGWLFLALELLKEGSLRDLLKREEGPLRIDHALGIARELCSGLQDLADSDCFHGHLDARAVLFKKGEVRLAGYYPAVIEQIQRSSTAEGRLVIEPAYIAPEQIQGDPCDYRADMYALSVLLFEMCTGTRPFSGNNALQTAMVRMTKPPPSPRSINNSISEELEATILRGLSIDPDERFEDFKSLRTALGGDEEVERPAPDATSRSVRGSVDTISIGMSTAHLKDILESPTARTAEDSTASTQRVKLRTQAVSAEPRPPLLRVAFSYLGAAAAGAVLVFLVGQYRNTSVQGDAAPRSVPTKSTSSADPRAEALRAELELEARVFERQQSEKVLESKEVNKGRIKTALASAEEYRKLGQIVLPEGSNAYEQIESAFSIEPDNQAARAMLYEIAAKSVLAGDRAKEQAELLEMDRAYLTAQALGVDPDFLSERKKGSEILKKSRSSVVFYSGSASNNRQRTAAGFLDTERLLQMIALYREGEEFSENSRRFVDVGGR